ncbi:MAG TPA: LacI family DNA-binding transcriptional regulator [bacterium]|nr:LacI family DNA-binding transcriptional regulator [bacterium]HPR89322.1 LacI family DNA-binding transcriptional regulator [bacterium]
MRPTIADIAQLARVSKATVSAVLNDRPGISPQTHARVLAVIKKFNYRPNELARSLSNRKTRSIGLVIKEIDNPYFARIMKGVFDICREHDYTVLLGSSELSPAQERQSIDALTSQRVGGLIISPLQGPDCDFTWLADLQRDHYPLVMLGQVKNYHTTVVDIDNVQAARNAVACLIGLGHRDIAYFAGPSYSSHSAERQQGYQQALMDHGLPVRPEFILPAGSERELGFQAGLALFRRPGPHPTAVFCYNDLVAIGLINALTTLEIDVPQAVSVIGCDDLDFSQCYRIPLTTIHVPAYEIGCSAATRIIQALENDNDSSPQIVLFEARLVERTSCAPARHHLI